MSRQWPSRAGVMEAQSTGAFGEEPSAVRIFRRSSGIRSMAGDGVWGHIWL